MRLVFVDESWEDYLYWQKTDKKNPQKNKFTYKRYLQKSPFRPW